MIRYLSIAAAFAAGLTAAYLIRPALACYEPPVATGIGDQHFTPPATTVCTTYGSVTLCQ